ncbi:hypothetical protein BEN47_16380 [Hymenobacter lapidarius]|uniref:Uncharacterized protein n=1 Tax=Hymenobacter lapidarius TaxID=1908237 RepID=A0A1G1T0R4_9BACT|nr:hypothetical protein BEN47_16380 [Hymenobacter lapidarius]
MKRLFVLLVLVLAASPDAPAQSRKHLEAEAFRRHFHRLDSLVLASSTDTVLNCPQEIEFMQKHTGLISTATGGWAGLFHCYKSDVRAWHEWYAHKYEGKER